MKIEGIPDGWELFRVGRPVINADWVVNRDGTAVLCELEHFAHNWPIIRKIENPKNPKQYRPFANAAEYVANRREGFAVDLKSPNARRGFYAVVSANDSFLWVAFGDVIRRFDWANAFEKLQFRHVDNSTSPFGIEVTE